MADEDEDFNPLDALENERGNNLFESALSEYPYLADKDIAFQYSPGRGRGFLEFYQPDEPGSEEFPRPTSLPMGKPGIEVFDPKTRPIDVLADYVSHYGVQTDPFLGEKYGAFAESLTPEQRQRLLEQYDYYKKNPQYNETRPYAEWEKSVGLPGYFRGYTFNQWERPEELYVPKQLELLNEVRKYLGIK